MTASEQSVLRNLCDGVAKAAAVGVGKMMVLGGSPACSVEALAETQRVRQQKELALLLDEQNEGG